MNRCGKKEKRHGKFGKMMKIGITGASGNLGSQLLPRLNSIKNNQIFPIVASNFSVEKSALEMLDVVIHSATCYGRNNENFSEIMSGNLLVPLKILEVMKGGQTFINIDTVLQDDVSSYAFSKGCFRESCKFLIDQGFKAKIINIRLHSFYGIQSSKSDMIYNLTKQFLQNVASIDLTVCLQKRDFVFIEDVVDGIVAVTKNLNLLPDGFSEIEIGSGRALALKDIVLMIKELTNSTSRINFGAIPLRQNEPMNLCADIAKMTELGWSPKTSIEDGIVNIIKNIK